MAVQTAPRDFHLYMRVDTNTRGHNQWFHFSVQNQNNSGLATFTILNFTKRSSLYNQGMRICVKTTGSNWHRDGICISYRQSRLKSTRKKYYELSFTYNFKTKHDTVYFAYCLPYTYSQLTAHLKTLDRLCVR